MSKMTSGLYRSKELPPSFALTFWLCFHLMTVVKVHATMSQGHSSMSVSAPYMSYACPEGASVRLVCAQKGAKEHPGDQLRHRWRFTPHMDNDCHEKVHPRGAGANHGQGNNSHALPPGVQYGIGGNYFWVSLENVTQGDQGRYCCQSLEFEHMKLVLRPHSHVLLTVTPRRPGSSNCTHWNPRPQDGSVSAGLATAACIMAIFSLPVILVLVYKQRQNAQSSRRAQELVRMDSEGLGHENPMFLGGSPQVKTRTVSQIMTRQSSESGRHLLSEPGTPLSPPPHGDVFFPVQDPIPESPTFLQV
ncbi:V-type immunoglobulin domain-containing suppressor of T-cell activation [Osmerus mordax]|uniref:V-type immunoglobulin domain-containing suppressor of T-cell activation n=1 Tax=Osmerus mordax TaxID=8014 RepID=UPI00350F7A30